MRLHIVMQYQRHTRDTYTSFLPKHHGAYEPNQTVAAYWVLLYHNKDNVFLLEVVYKLAKGLVLLTMV